MNQALVDWNTIKIQYELLNAEVDELSDEYDISPSSIRYAIEHKGWERKAVANAVQNLESVDDLSALSDEVREAAKQQLSITSLLKQQALGKQYFILESTLINKAIEVANNINAELPSSSSQLKVATDALKNLKETNLFFKLHEAANDMGGDAQKVVVNILNKVEPVS